MVRSGREGGRGRRERAREAETEAGREAGREVGTERKKRKEECDHSKTLLPGEENGRPFISENERKEENVLGTCTLESPGAFVKKGCFGLRKTYYMGVSGVKGQGDSHRLSILTGILGHPAVK